MSMTVAHIEVPEAKIAALCRDNGIRKLALFGSVLTDRFSDDSDIDVLVEFRPHERIGFFRLADIQDELSRLLDGRTIDLRTPMDLSRHFREEVVRDASVVYAEPGTIRLRHMHEPVTMALHMAAGRSRTELSSDPMLAMALTRTLEILGEGASRLSDEAPSFYEHPIRENGCDAKPADPRIFRCGSGYRLDDRRRGSPSPSACP